MLIYIYEQPDNTAYVQCVAGLFLLYFPIEMLSTGVHDVKSKR